MICNRCASETLRVESDLFHTRRLPFPHLLKQYLDRSFLETNPSLYADRGRIALGFKCYRLETFNMGLDDGTESTFHSMTGMYFRPFINLF